jgi:hypothetical protein
MALFGQHSDFGVGIGPALGGLSGQHHALATLASTENTRHQLDRRLGGPHSRSGRYGEERNTLSPPRIESRFHGRPTRLSQRTDCAIPLRHSGDADMSVPKLGKPTFLDYKFCLKWHCAICINE